jgi:thioredoxin reductase (NADPH)
MPEQIIIAGTGPAGLTAALYLARADRGPLVIEGDLPGGQLTTTTMVENYSGFEQGIMGPELMDIMRRQAGRFGARYKHGIITSADLSRRPFQVTVDNDVLECHTLIIATGASPRLLGLDSERKLMGRGISSCATCDGAFFRQKKIIVVGGGDSAMEEATFLTKYADKVHVVHRRGELRASKAMQKKAMENNKIEFVWNTVVEDITDVGKSTVTGVTLRNTKTGLMSSMKIDGIFVAIGHDPNTTFLKGQLDMDDHGYIRCREQTCATSVEGVFACGDVMDLRYRQVATSVGAGCRAAMDCEEYLGTRREKETEPELIT